MKKPRIEPMCEESNYAITDLSIEQLVPNVFNNYLVTIYEDRQLIVLPYKVPGPQFKTWRKGRGGQFSRDVLNYAHKKFDEVGKYILVQGEGQNFIARLISDDEKIKFEALKLIDGQIKDKPFMLLRKLNEGDSLTNTQSDVNELYESEVIPNPEDITTESDESVVDDEEELDYRGNVALFTDDE